VRPRLRVVGAPPRGTGRRRPLANDRALIPVPRGWQLRERTSHGRRDGEVVSHGDVGLERAGKQVVVDARLELRLEADLARLGQARDAEELVVLQVAWPQEKGGWGEVFGSRLDAIIYVCIYIYIHI